MIALLDRAASIWSGWMWAMTWQATLFILIVWAVDRLIRRWAWPQVCHALWLLVLLKLITPPWLALPTSLTAGLFDHAPAVTTQPAPAAPAPPLPPLPDHVAEQATSAPAPVVVEPGAAPPQVAAPAPTVSASIGWKAMAMLTWFAGVIGLGVVVVARWHGLRHEFMEEDRGDRPEAITRLVAKIAAGMGLHRVPTVVFSNKAASPAVFGPLRPVLILTQDLRGRAADPALRYILLHELAHIKRGDLLVQTLCVALQAIYWFNPLLWIVRRRLQALRELCCDATVAGILKEETPLYRETLLNTAERLLERRAGFGLGLLGLVEEPGTLLARLGRLEKQIWKHPRLRMGIVAVTIAAVSMFVLPMAKSEDGAVKKSGPEPDGGVNALKADMIRAYGSVSTYMINVKITASDRKTRKPVGEEIRYQFAFNRAQNSFRYDNTYPGMRDSKPAAVVTACNGRNLWILDSRPLMNVDNKNVRLANRVMETSVTQPLNHQWLVTNVPTLNELFLPVLSFLLGRDPIAELDRMMPSGGTALQISRVDPRADDPSKRPGLKIAGWPSAPGRKSVRALTYWLDAQTHLVTQVTIDMLTCEKSDDPLIEVEGTVDVQTVCLNEPIDQKLFSLDTEGLDVVRTYDELFNSPSRPLRKKASSEAATEQEKGSGRVAGHVTDYQHQPVDKCEVIFIPLGSREALRDFWERGRDRLNESYALTDSNGEYLSPELPAGEYTVYFNARGLGRAETSKRIAIHKGATVQSVDQALFPEVVYSGTVIDEAGAPVRDAHVAVVRVPIERIKTKRFIPAFYDKYKTRTDGNGHFQLDRLPPLLQGDQYDLIVEHPAFINAHQVGLTTDKETSLEIAMKRGCAIHGRVASADKDTPIEGAVISAYQVKAASLFRGDEGGLKFYKQTASGKDGAFAFDGLEPGYGYQFIARRGNQVSALDDANERKALSGTNPPLELKLLNGAIVDLTVVDAAQKPVPNIKINLVGDQSILIENHGAADHRHSRLISKTTDKNGKIRFEGLENCELRVGVDQDEGYGHIYKNYGQIEPGKVYPETFILK